MTCECRFSKHKQKYTLQMWGEEGRYQCSVGDILDMPEWLDKIVQLVIIGDHGHRVPYPPPEMLFWFLVDDSNNLISLKV